MDKQNYAFVKVTLTEQYIIPVYSDGKSLDGRSVEDITKEWFERFDPNTYHASREAYRLGNSRKFINYETTKE